MALWRDGNICSHHAISTNIANFYKYFSIIFIPMLTGEYVSRIEKKAIEKIRAEFSRHG